jgi:HK97 family phage major capsid protein
LKELVEKKNEYLDQMDEILENAKRENRAFNSDENSKLVSLRNKVDMITREIEKEPRGFGNMETIKGNEVEQRKFEMNEEQRFIDYMLGDKRALSAGSSGAVIPLHIAQQIIKKAKEISPVIGLATQYNVGGDLSLPSYDWTQITTGYIAENTAATQSGADFTGVTLKSVIATALVLVSNSLINRGDVNVVQIIVDQLALSIANFLESEVLNGVGGAGKIQGSFKTGVTNSVTGATTLVIGADELIDVQMSIKSVYQDGAMWFVNPTLWKQIRKLKDSTGQYLIGSMENGDGFTLLGKPVHLSDNLPVLGVNSKSLYYGNPKGYALKFAKQVELKVLQERWADSYQTGILGHVEVDGIVADTQALAVYIGK